MVSAQYKFVFYFKRFDVSIIRPGALFGLLLWTSQFESTLRDMFQRLLDAKEGKWDALRTEGRWRC